MTELLPELWRDRMHDLNNLTFVVEDGANFTIKPENHRWEPQGKKVLIIDVDSRLDLSWGAMLNKARPSRKLMKGRTGGILNHFLYGRPTR